MSAYDDGGRYELKYTLPVSMREAILAHARGHIEPDPHGELLPFGTRGYRVHSLYFDTPELSDYAERLERRQVRVRLRARTYGQLGERHPVFLEDKRKLDHWVVKQRVKICNSDQLLATPGERPWAYWAERLTGKARYIADHFVRRVDGEGRVPVSIVHYMRESFADSRPEYREVRLTLDHALSATTQDLGLELRAPPDVDLLPPDYMVVELKFGGTQPGWMRTLVRELGLVSEPLSKFALSVAAGRRGGDRRDLEALLPHGVKHTGWRGAA